MASRVQCLLTLFRGHKRHKRCGNLILTSTKTVFPGIATSVTVIENEVTPVATFDDKEPLVSLPTPVYSSDIKDSDVYEDNGLGKILSRNYYVDTIHWSGNSPAGTVIGTYLFPKALFTNPGLIDRLSRFDLFRAGVKVSVRVNATGFHYGKLLISYLPNYNPTTSAVPSSDPTYKFGNLHRASQNHCIEISANSNVPVEFTIPWRSDSLYMDLSAYGEAKVTQEMLGQIGTVVVFVENPLQCANDSGVPQIDVALFANFESPEVAGPTGLERDLISLSEVNDTAIWHAQGHVDQEQRQRSKEGTLSDIATSASKFAGTLKGIPLIGGVMSMVAPFLSGVGKTLRVFGYDKPTSVQAPSPSYLQFGLSMANGKGLDTAQKLCLDPENAVGCSSSLVGTGENETDFSAILSKPYLLKVGSFDGQNATGAILMAIPVSPLYCNATGVVTDQWFTVDTSLQAYYCSMFDYWRGAMSYSFRFSASSYTTARLRISWVPNVGDYYDDLTLLNGSEVVSKVVDVRGDTIVDFDVPLLSTTLWKKGGNILVPQTYGNETEIENFCNGVILVSVVNPALTSSSSFTTSISYSVWSYCSDSFQVAKYKGLPAGVSIGVTGLSEAPDYSWYAQGGLVPATSNYDTGILMGEQVRDLKTVLHRYHYEGVLEGAAGGFKGFQALVPSVLSKSGQLSPLLIPFLWVRGSQRWKFVWVSGAKPIYISMRPKMPLDVDAPASTELSIFSNPLMPRLTPLGQGGSTILYGTVFPETTVELPFFSTKMALPTWSGAHGASPYDDKDESFPTNVRLDANATFSVDLWFSYGDDVELGMLSAAPTVTIINRDKLSL